MKGSFTLSQTKGIFSCPAQGEVAEVDSVPA